MGKVYLLKLRTERCKTWIKENTDFDLKNDSIIKVERRYIDETIDTMEDAGFKISEDFEIWII